MTFLLMCIASSESTHSINIPPYSCSYTTLKNNIHDIAICITGEQVKSFKRAGASVSPVRFRNPESTQKSLSRLAPTKGLQFRLLGNSRSCNYGGKINLLSL